MRKDNICKQQKLKSTYMRYPELRVPDSVARHTRAAGKWLKHGLLVMIAAQMAVFPLISCRSSSLSQTSSDTIGYDNIPGVADKVWSYCQSHPEGFTLDIRTMSEPKAGIAVGYAATQNNHSRQQLSKVVEHALKHDGYVGGWLNNDDGQYYFDSTKLFPEDSLAAAIKFGEENGQIAIFILSNKTEIPLGVKYSKKL